jgi:hypothetical protein
MAIQITGGITFDGGVNFSTPTVVPPDGLTPETASSSAWQIKQDYPASTDGLYWIQNANIAGGTPVQIYADMTTDGGGWTLIMQNTVPTWNFGNALERNQFSPPSSLEVAHSNNDGANYSIIGWADYIKRSASGFEYMMEAGARNSNGGIFTANEAYSFVGQVDLTALTAQGIGVYFGGPSQELYTGSQGFRQNVTLTTKFGSWNHNNNGLEKRMPWFTDNLRPGQAIITTTNNDGGSWWGTLISEGASFQPAPWNEVSNNPGIIWYWVR